MLTLDYEIARSYFLLLLILLTSKYVYNSNNATLVIIFFSKETFCADLEQDFGEH